MDSLSQLFIKFKEIMGILKLNTQLSQLCFYVALRLNKVVLHFSIVLDLFT